jgi:hypothetical protein
MRKLALLVPALLAACATAPAPTPVEGETPGHKCDAAGTEQFIGQPATTSTGAAIERATNAAVLRWAPPGAMLTMDFREDRVTVYFGPDKKVTKINCG